MIIDDNEFENAVLGAILLEEEALETIIDELKPDLFQDERNQHICRAILVLHKERIKIDMMMVSRKVKEMGYFETVGGSFYIASLTDRIASSANIQVHLKVMQQHYLVRQICDICQKTLIKCNEPKVDGFDVIEDIRKKLEKLEDDITSNKQFDTIDNLGDKFINELEQRRSGIFPPSTKSGLLKLDETGGFFNTDSIIVGARPGMGKTAFALKVIRNCIIHEQKSCGVFSLEMSSLQLLARLASAECEIDSELIRDGKVTNQMMNEIHAKIKELRKLKLYIDDTAAIDIDRLCNKARKMKRDFGIKLLVIDYLGLITTTEYRGQKTNEVGYISRKIKQLAKELEIPIITLAQLSRKVEERKADDRMPILSDLRDTGDIEQDADQIYFIFRPQYYGLSKYFFNGREVETNGKAFIDCKKNRHGKVMTGLFRFINKYTDFCDDTDQLTLDVAHTDVTLKDFSQPSPKKNDDDNLPF
jgi:replicative DNA helicase